MNPFTHKLLCCALLFLTLKELTEACSCIASHPQQQFCSADIVFRAKVIGEKIISVSDSADSVTQYEIKMVKMFTGYEKMNDVRYVYTPSSSSACGVTLTVKREYLLGGTIYDGKVRIYLCGLNVLWNDLSEFQRNSISQPHMGYQSGCDCKIRMCGMESCNNLAPNECPWIDENMQTLNLQHACIKLRNGSCSWYPSISVKSTYSNHP